VNNGLPVWKNSSTGKRLLKSTTFKFHRRRNMNCPVCNVALVMAERQGVEIDYCPQCRGIWLDRGELDKIIERTEQQNVVKAPAPPASPAYGYERDSKHHDDHHRDHNYDKHHYDGHHRKKSLLRDLFD
jgi:uncharacterized protein